MSAAKRFLRVAGLVAALSSFLVVREAAAQTFTTTTSATAPVLDPATNTHWGHLTYHIPGSSGQSDVSQASFFWRNIDDRQDLGQSFRTGNCTWQVNTVIVRVNVQPVFEPYHVQFWTIANNNTTSAGTLLKNYTGLSLPGAPPVHYWWLNLSENMTLSANTYYAFMLGFHYAAPPASDPNRITWLAVGDRYSNTDFNYPNGRLLFHVGRDLTVWDDPQKDDPPPPWRDLHFYLYGYGCAGSTGDDDDDDSDQGANGLGGILVNDKGLVRDAERDALGELSKLRSKALQEIPAELGVKTELRKLSLKGIAAAIAESVRSRKKLPDALKYLGGLQRIRYVFVYPEQNDIILAGPAEGWVVDGRGNLVGRSTGRPVMMLDDLVHALEAAQLRPEVPITCSINPTPEGLSRLQNLMSTLRSIADPQATTEAIEEALGPQQVRVNGVPCNSHFAYTLVAADYRMKRIAMGFEPAPVAGLPSFLQLVKASGRGMSNMLPRWWLEPKYEPLLRDEEGLAWEIRGAGVKAMTEEDFLMAGGQTEHTGKASFAAQKWADLMTQKYHQLAVAEPVFGELQNCMDLAIVASLIAKEKLMEKAGGRLQLLTDPLDPDSLYPIAFNVDTKSSVFQAKQNWVISASGGVKIAPQAIVAKTRTDAAPAKVRAANPFKSTDKWWSN